MGRIVFDSRVSEVISDSSKVVIIKDGFVGDSIYKIGVNKGDITSTKKEFILYATLNSELICINNVRNDLDEGSAERMLLDIVRKIQNDCEIIPNIDVSIISNPNEEAKFVEQPIAIRLCSDYDFSADDKLSKVICNDIIDWLDELSVMKTAKISDKEKENYQQEYEKLMSASLIPHDESEIKNYSSTMAIVTAAITIVGIFIRSMCVIPIIALVSSFFSGYRCFTNKSKVPGIICGVCGVVALICAYIGWQEFFTSFKVK